MNALTDAEEYSGAINKVKEPPANLVVDPKTMEIHCLTCGGDRRIMHSDLYSLAVQEFDAITGSYFDRLSFEPRSRMATVCLEDNYDQELVESDNGMIINHYHPNNQKTQLYARDCNPGLCITPADSNKISAIRFSLLDKLVSEFAPELTKSANIWSGLDGVTVTFNID